VRTSAARFLAEGTPGDEREACSAY
jgi:hypothetical protein